MVEIISVDGLEPGERLDVELLQGRTTPIPGVEKDPCLRVFDDEGLGGMRAEVNGKVLQFLGMNLTSPPWLKAGEHGAIFRDEESGKKYSFIFKPEMDGRIVARPKGSFTQRESKQAEEKS